MSQSPVQVSSPALAAQPITSTLSLLPPRTRGPHNKKFCDLKVLTNHYSVSLQEIEKIYIFKVIITPKLVQDNSHLRQKLMNSKHKQISEQIFNPIFGGFNIYSTSAPVAPEKQYTCDEYKIIIKQVKVYDLTQNPKLLLAFLNNSLRNIMSKFNYVQIGRSGKYFNGKQKTNIENLIMYNGYKSNFVHLEKGYFLRVDPAKKIVRNQTVLEFMDSLYVIHKDKDKEEKRNIIKGELIGKIVMSNYGKTQYYQINDIQFKQITQVMIQEKMSLTQYYLQKYKIKIEKLKQPLLVSTTRNKARSVYLIPQLMLMTGIPQNFDEFRRKKISEQTIKDPTEKVKEIESLMNKLKDAKQLKTLEQIGIKISTKLQKIQAKQIPVPQLQLGKNNSVDKGKQSFFNLFNKPIFSAKHDIPCKIIHFRNVDTREFEDVIKRTSKNLGVDITITTASLGTPSISTIQKEVARAVDEGVKICCIVIPMSMKTSYKDIKILTLKQLLVTQIVTEATLRKKNLQSIATKILLQIIAKRGNILWVPKTSVEIQSTMLVAFDQSKVGAKTLLAICATINSTFSLVYTSTRIFEGVENKYKTMNILLGDALKAFQKRNKGVPQELICFQNTCPGDQISLYHQLFVEPSIKNMKEAYKEDHIAISLVMINVKTNERFFSEKSNTVTNVPAGTLVCKGLVSQNYDFYIVSQQSTRGSAVPNHYKVIYSDSKLQEGILQEISFSQCFNYVNWTGSIKIPAILQYAKKAARFGSEVLNEMAVPEQLHSKLYFV